MGTLTRFVTFQVLPEEEAKPFIKKALELGINFFDTASKDFSICEVIFKMCTLQENLKKFLEIHLQNLLFHEMKWSLQRKFTFQ